MLYSKHVLKEHSWLEAQPQRATECTNHHHGEYTSDRDLKVPKSKRQ